MQRVLEIQSNWDQKEKLNSFGIRPNIMNNQFFQATTPPVFKPKIMELDTNSNVNSRTSSPAFLQKENVY